MLEQEPKVPQGKIASMFRVSQSQVSRIMKNKEAIMAQWNRFATPDRKRCRLGKAGALEQKLVDWYKEAKKEDLPISGPILMEKAKSIGNEMGIDFKPSAGWLGRWKDRNGVTLKRFKDKDGAPSVTKVGNHWRRYMFTKATKDYSLQDVWVVEETALVYNALPEHLTHGAAQGDGKLSVILACNLAGTERKPPVIVGSSQTLGSATLPAPYHYHPESVITLDLFSSWLKEWDRELHTKRKKIVLLMSRLPHHPENPHVFNINVTYFPPDTSTVLQPLNLGIISVFKSLYRYQQLKYLMARTQASEKIGLGGMFNQNIISGHSLTLSLLDAVFMVYKAWKHVSPETIVKGVVKAGMSKDVDALNVSDQVPAPPGISQEDFEALVSVDEELSATEHTEHTPHPPQPQDTQAKMLTSVQFPQYPNMYGIPGSKTPQANHHMEVSTGVMQDYPGASEAVYACQVLRQYLQKQGGELYDEFSHLESVIHMDMILDARPDLNNYQGDPLHDPASVHSLVAHKVAFEHKVEYLQKMQDEIYQQKAQKEMKKVTQSPAVYQPPHGPLNTAAQDVRTDIHTHLLGMQHSAMPGQEMLRQDLHHPMQHPDLMRQDMMRPEYRQEVHQDRPRNSLLELRSVNVATFRHGHGDMRNELSNDGKNDAMPVPTDLKNLPSDNHSGAELHHHGMDVAHGMRQPEPRMDNTGIPYYTLTNPLPHYMQSK